VHAYPPTRIPPNVAIAGTAFKRDRLRHRNAVLKSTGFLETPATPLPIPSANELGLVGAERIPTGSGMKGTGGLSQALLQVGSPAAGLR
jgi:hypothetical protein